MPALYRKYRSGSFDEVIGQSQVTDVLEASLRQNRTTHGYLFVGPHGVGKTSVARILAFAINHLDYKPEQKHIDIIEIDAASNTGVDNIRDLIDKAQITPSLAEKKIYIIDEVHMLSKSAFNALLKLLEEPPKHIVFILATTEENKVPATIISRMQKFVFRRIPTALIVEHLTSIAKKEKIKISTNALTAIAEVADGGMRDSISLFDQLASLANQENTIDEEVVYRVLGLIDQKTLTKILGCYMAGDFSQILEQLEAVKKQNIAIGDIAKQLAKFTENKIAEAPELVDLLAKLVNVPKSPMPAMSLTIALFPPNFKTKEITISKIVNETKPTVSTTDKKEIVSPKAEKSPQEPKKPVSTPKPKANKSEIINFNWNEFVTTVAKQAKPIAGYLKTASYEIHDQNLHIKLHSSFEKKMLDAPARLNQLYDALKKMSYDGFQIETEIDKKIAQANKKRSMLYNLWAGERR